MNTLGNFIESDVFFPILMILLLLLIGVFIWIVLSNRKQERLYKEKKRSVKIDEDAQIKIVDEGSYDFFDNDNSTEDKDVEEDILDEKDKAMLEYQKEIKKSSDEIAVPELFVSEKEDNIEIPHAKEEKKLSKEDEKIKEAFELPNFNNEDDIIDEELEREIIESANKYIAAIMHKDSEKEEDMNGQESGV